MQIDLFHKKLERKIARLERRLAYIYDDLSVFKEAYVRTKNLPSPKKESKVEQLTLFGT